MTVGTTPFDELIEVVDRGPHAETAFLQIADGRYRPAHSPWARFVDDVAERASAADVVVTHAGAGSVFALLQAGRMPVVVPNLVRRDGHQVELLRWLEARRYAIVAHSVDEVNGLVERHARLQGELRPFDVERFFFGAELNADLRAAVARLPRR